MINIISKYGTSIDLKLYQLKIYEILGFSQCCCWRYARSLLLGKCFLCFKEL